MRGDEVQGASRAGVVVSQRKGRRALAVQQLTVVGIGPQAVVVRRHSAAAVGEVRRGPGRTSVGHNSDLQVASKAEISEMTPPQIPK